MTPRLVREKGTVPVRGLSLFLLLSLSLPATPALALRTQAGLESQTADTLATTLTGLEEPTLADVQAALRELGLDTLRWVPDAVHPLTRYAVVFAGEAAVGALLMHQRQSFDAAPSFIPFAVTTDPTVIARLTAAGFPSHRILEASLDRLRPSPNREENPLVNLRPITRLLTTRPEALDYLLVLGKNLQFPAGPDPNRLTAAITHALDLLARYL